MVNRDVVEVNWRYVTSLVLSRGYFDDPVTREITGSGGRICLPSTSTNQHTISPEGGLI